jgi:chemotaxis protein CheD
MAMPDNDVYLNSGDFEFAEGRVRLRTILGSCVAVTAWHPTKRLGGMCHFLLPVRGSAAGNDHGAAMYAEQAVELFEREFLRRGVSKENFVIKMFGGGSMFPQHSASRPCMGSCTDRAAVVPCRDVPCSNITLGRALFEQHGFVITGGDVGGTGSRQLIFDVWSGDVWVRRGPAALDREAK